MKLTSVPPLDCTGPVRDRMLVFGGEVWSLVWGTPVSVPANPGAVPGRFALTPPRPNPSRAETFVDFDLEEPARVVLDVFDTQGRRVKRIADEWFTAGRHGRIWRGDDEAGRTMGGGVFFIRMQAGGFHATRRMVRMR